MVRALTLALICSLVVPQTVWGDEGPSLAVPVRSGQTVLFDGVCIPTQEAALLVATAEAQRRENEDLRKALQDTGMKPLVIAGAAGVLLGLVGGSRAAVYLKK
jgi:hypothetical protein